MCIILTKLLGDNSFQMETNFETFCLYQFLYQSNVGLAVNTTKCLTFNCHGVQLPNETPKLLTAQSKYISRRKLVQLDSCSQADCWPRRLCVRDTRWRSQCVAGHYYYQHSLPFFSLRLLIFDPLRGNSRG